MADPPSIRLVTPGQNGIWRVGRADSPLSPSRITADDADHPGGNRFDVVGVGVTSFATELEGCFAETLARFRVPPGNRTLLQDDPEWRERHFMEPGSVPADWRHRRIAVRVTLDRPYALIDVDTLETHVVLDGLLASKLGELGIDQLDVGVVRGRDRRVTRLLAAFAAAPDPSSNERFAGIRYVSRLGTWECWAVFEWVRPVLEERLPITADLPALQSVAKLFGLRIY